MTWWIICIMMLEGLKVHFIILDFVKNAEIKLSKQDKNEQN